MSKTCFVIMGFHKKTDYPTGRTLDLDKSYRLLIKPSADECGLTCVRADEIPHSGVIDVPMYQHLLESDLVIADLSTSNPNALYELGVRHALRSFSTIVIAESRLQYPFDIAHTAIRSYQHLGEAIDYDEVIRFRGELKTAITAILARQEKDSPVYTYLPALRPPSLAGGRGGRGVKRSGGQAEPPTESAAALIDQAESAMERHDFALARACLASAHAMRPASRPWTANDDFVIQRLALATAMSATPDPASALAEAHTLLQPLKPVTSNDSETVRLWGLIARGLWDSTHDRAHLDEAVLAYERAFCLGNDPTAGLNYALVLNVRASIAGPVDAVADFVQARRVRRRVVDICHAELRGRVPVLQTTDPAAAGRAPQSTGGYAIRAALAEALLGLGNREDSDRWRQEAFALDVPEHLKTATSQRLESLTALLEPSPLRFVSASAAG